MTYTSKQLADWKVYECIRKDGRFNMFDPRAREATGLSLKSYSFVMQNYSRLKEEIAKAIGEK